ncbi:MAG: N utilization substance protein A [Alphaproteobacteria bacterium]|jgi:N utilization substance protein A
MSLELLQVADAVAREKDIDKESILMAMEESIQMAARRKYGMHLNVVANMDRLSGDVALKKVVEVVNLVTEPINEEEYRLAQREQRPMEMRTACDKRGYPLTENSMQILLVEAQKRNPDVKLGDFLSEDLPPIAFGRIAAQAAKQVIFQKVREAERVKEYESFKENEGQIVSGTVKRTDYGGTTLDLGTAEGFIPRDELLPRESYRSGDRVRAYIYNVKSEVRGPQVFLSRTHPEFLKKLFEEEVPEIGNGVIEIMGVARDAGFRAKIAVKSYDANLDPVGACVGMRGSRVQNITTELQGERIDIIAWKANPADYLVESLAPAEVSKIVLDEDEQRIEVVVPEDKLSVAIGRRGQNVRLASILTGWNIDIMSEAEEEARRQKEFETVSKSFIEGLDVDETITHVLVNEGFTSINELLMVSIEEIAAIEGFNTDLAIEIQARAQKTIDAQVAELKKAKVEQELVDLHGLKIENLLHVVRKDIKTLDDFAELATDELLELLPEGAMTQHQAESLIMEARKHWFEDEDEDADDVPSEVPVAEKATKTHAKNV